MTKQYILKWVLSALFIILSNIAISQQTVHGVVANKKGEPESKVRVLVVDTDVDTFSDSIGKYSITVPEGYRVLTFAKKGFISQSFVISGPQQDVIMLTADYSEMTLDDLRKESKVSVASGVGIKQNPDEAPAIVSVVTSEDIERFGARDLSDILRMVPGFEFGLDVNSIIGTSFRGIWAFEGKIAFMLNGTCINEMGFGLFNMIGTIPANMIERVEIIRGSGSSLYGGFAEVAVVNIVTLTRETLKNKALLHVNAGLMGRGSYTGGSDLSLGLSTSNNETELFAHIGYGHTLLSTKEYTPFISYNNTFFCQQTSSTTTLNAKNAYRDPSYIIINGKVKNLKFNFLRNTFDYGAQNSWFIRPQINGVNGEARNHTVIGTKLYYDISMGKNYSMTPLFEYTQTNLMATPVNATLSHQGNFRNSSLLFQRLRAEVVFKYKDKIMLGNGFWKDYAHSMQLNGNPGFQTSADKGDTTNLVTAQSYYTILQYTDRIWGIGTTVGIRSEFTTWGYASAPRLGLTYTYQKWNFKVIQGSSYRVPMLFQAYTRLWAWSAAQPKALVPEKANTLEFESGYKANENVFVKLNVFHIKIHNPLVFHESYVNADQVQSIGAETEIDMKINSSGIKCNFSYARPMGKTSADFLTADKAGFIGIAPLKVNLMTYKIIKKLTISSTLTYLSERKGVTQNYAQQLFDGVKEIPAENKTYKSIFLLNFNILLKSLLNKRLDVSATLYNALNSNYVVIQPYYDLGAPMPVNDRHFVLNVTWRFDASH